MNWYKSALADGTCDPAGSLSSPIMLMPLWLCIGTVGYEEPLQLDPPHKAFSHLFPGARDPQTFALCVPASVYKNNEEEGRQSRSRGAEKKGRAWGLWSWWPYQGSGKLQLLWVRVGGILEQFPGPLDSTYFSPEEGRRFSSTVSFILPSKEENWKICWVSNPSVLFTILFQELTMLSETHCPHVGTL